MAFSRVALRVFLLANLLLFYLQIGVGYQAHAQGSPGVLGEMEERLSQLRAEGKTLEEIKLLKQALALSEKTYGPDHPTTISHAEFLGLSLTVLGRTEEARPYCLRVTAARERWIAGKKDVSAEDYARLSSLYGLMGEYAKAEAVAKKSLAVQEQRYGPSHPEFANALQELSDVYSMQKRYPEEVLLTKRVIMIRERTAKDVASRVELVGSMNILVARYISLDRLDEAEALAKRSLAIVEADRELAGINAALSNSNLGQIYSAQGNFKEAEKVYRRAVTLERKSPKLVNDYMADTWLGGYLGALADVLFKLGRHDEAERLAKEAIPLARMGRSAPDDTMTAAPISTLARVEQARQHYASADQLFQRAEKLHLRIRGPENIEYAYALGERAGLKRAEGNLPEAYELAKKATSVLTRNIRRRLTTLTMTATGQTKPQSFYHRPTFSVHIGIAADLDRQTPERSPSLGAETFELSQWIQNSQAGAALSQMAARFANGEGELAELVRRRQDLVRKYQILEQKIVTALAKPAAERVKSQEDAWRKSSDELERSLADLDRLLAGKFPEYAALSNPAPLSVKEVQAQLKKDEALVQFAVNEMETYAWVVTADDLRWAAIPIGSRALADEVAALRCGLDEAAWVAVGPADQASASASRCEKGLGIAGSRGADGGLPFDLARAHVLYVKLLSPFEAQIKGKHLLYVPSGPLTTLPLHVLVTSPPDASITGPKRYEKAAWLGIAQPITVLPSVSSLKSVRSYARTSSAPSPFAGFGNPLLSGQDGKDRSAWAKQACGDSATTQLVAERKPVRSTLRALYRDRYADVEAIRRQTPLPETADEICFVAKALGASPDAIFLGSNATETRIKSLSDSGTLKSWRVLHFATHGLVAGETQSMSLNQAEPALLLTPPDAASEKDDGLLTASEVAKLRLDADWVILSACNTAAADGTPSAEALSGLASAFLYAGARSLVVSHWYVNSEAAVKLITDMFAELRRKPEMPRAEALRWSIGARLLEGGARAHPSYWGPFVVVGAAG